ncbi:MAG: hypothetical protein ACYC1X_10050 [Coriobacteriia bacterium]
MIPTATDLLDTFERVGFAVDPRARAVLKATHGLSKQLVQDAAADALSAAIASGDQAEIIAAIPASLDAHAPLLNEVLSVIRDKAEQIVLHQLFDRSAAFAHIETLYKSAAGKLEAACAVVDPDAAPETLDPEDLPAWQSVPSLVATMDRLAGLARVLLEMGGHDFPPRREIRAAHELPVIAAATPRTAHTAVIQAWDAYRAGTPSRAGVYYRLVKAGAVLALPASGGSGAWYPGRSSVVETVGMRNGGYATK